MSQISRPYQIALVVLVLAAATWFVAFGRHSSSGGGSSASSSAPSASPQSSGGSSDSSSSQVYHGSAPGVEGLTKAVAKAHGAVAASEANAHKLQEKSAQATSTTPAESGAASSGSASKGSSTAHGAGTSTTPATHASKPSTTHVTRTTHVTKTPTKTTSTHVTKTPTKTVTKTTTKTTTTHVVHHSAPATAVGAPSGQKEVEAAVQKGKVALLLFWNPAGSNDRAVRSQVHAAGRKGVVVFESSAQNVASYGAITRQMPVYGTPTILIIGPHRTDSLVGLQDKFSIEQAIKEVRIG